MPEQAPDKHPVMRAFKDLVRKLDNPSEQEKSQDIVGQGEAERPTSAKEPTIKNRASHHRPVRMSARHYLSCLVADTKTCIEGSGGIHGDNEVSASAAF